MSKIHKFPHTPPLFSTFFVKTTKFLMSPLLKFVQSCGNEVLIGGNLSSAKACVRPSLVRPRKRLMDMLPIALCHGKLLPVAATCEKKKM